MFHRHHRQGAGQCFGRLTATRQRVNQAGGEGIPAANALDNALKRFRTGGDGAASADHAGVDRLVQRAARLTEGCRDMFKVRERGKGSLRGARILSQLS